MQWSTMEDYSLLLKIIYQEYCRWFDAWMRERGNSRMCLPFLFSDIVEGLSNWFPLYRLMELIRPLK